VDILGKIYIREIVRLHDIPVSIVSDRGSSFTSRFWKTLQKALGIQFNFSSVYHSQTDGQTERVNRVLEDMLRACFLTLKVVRRSTYHLLSLRIVTVTTLRLV